MAVLSNRFANEISDHWQIIAVAFCCLLFAFSAPAFVMPFLYPEVIREFGWTREQAVLLASWKYLTGSIVSVVVASWLPGNSNLLYPYCSWNARCSFGRHSISGRIFSRSPLK